MDDDPQFEDVDLGWVRRGQGSCGLLVIAWTFALLLVSATVSAYPWEKNFLLIGQVFPQECPVPGWLDKEPGYRYTVIPTDTDALGLTDEESRRFVRQYFPRTAKELFTGFHFIVMPDTQIMPFTGRQIMWMKEGFEEHGIGGFVTVGADLTGNYELEWINSPLHDVLPTSLKGQSRISGSFTIQILKDDPPILSMFKEYGVEKFPGSSPFSQNRPRDGSTTWADAKFTTGVLVAPWLVSWKLGVAGGYVWTASDDLDHEWWWPGGMRYQSSNPYSGDVFLNIVYYSMGRSLPDNIELIHEMRTRLGLYQTSRLMIRGTIEWAEKLGANVRKAESALGEVEETYKLALNQYASGEYDEAMRSLNLAMESSEDVLELAFKTKREAMFYIYAVEWLVTTGVLLLSGSIVYTLMIRRRLYKEVETTRPLRVEE